MNSANACTNDVQPLFRGEYQDSDIRTILATLNTGKGAFAKMTWRDIAKLPRFCVTNAATLNGYSRGRQIVNAEHRRAFGMAVLAPAKVCPIHGIVHQFDCECEQVAPLDARIITTPEKRRQRPPRRAIRLDDAESAAASIIGANVSREYLNRLAELISI